MISTQFFEIKYFTSILWGTIKFTTDRHLYAPGDFLCGIMILLALIGTLFTLEVYALELSHIRVSSKLNEPFNAKINISSIPKTSISSVQMRLASTTAFKRARLDRLYVLTKLQFTSQTVSQNKAVVHITTEQAIKEPFLNFVVEVQWIGGRWGGEKETKRIDFLI